MACAGFGQPGAGTAIADHGVDGHLGTDGIGVDGERSRCAAQTELAVDGGRSGHCRSHACHVAIQGQRAARANDVADDQSRKARRVYVIRLTRRSIVSRVT